ncbi:MAG: GntP family permease [Firmicutes bacterium]|jgi:H+/gluconate symporter-like permease|nr:GntP family permease [Bacillota bacterium]
MLGMLGIIISLGLLMYLAYRGITVLILAPLLAMLAVLFSGDIPALAGYTEVFMKGFAGFAKLYFPLFLLGAIFGKIMDEIGAAKGIAEFISSKLGADKAILSVVLSCAILTYGGVSLFVVAFAVYPIAAALFRRAEIPKRFIPASLALGSFTFTMTALPGTPQIQNAIPMSFFGTNSFAAPVLGLIGAAVMFGGGMFWITRRVKKAQAAGEGYGNHLNENIKEIDDDKLPSFFNAMLPIIIVLVVNYILSFIVFANMEAPYLEELYGTSISKVKGSWALIVALVVAILVAIIVNRKNIDDLKKTINDGAMGSLLAIMNTASEVGYGTVIKSLGAFAMVKTAILAIPGTPLISLAVSTSTLAGITGSASGGMSIALAALGETYMAKAQALGINPEAFHRIAAMACGGLDTLPHNGAVITLLAVTQLTHKDSYADLGMCTVVIPLIATAVAIVFATMGVV